MEENVQMTEGSLVVSLPQTWSR